MLLSILIPSIPSRFEKATDLYLSMLEMIGAREIEVLLLMDNKKRSIGEKREALKNASNGKYFMFVDDDDSLYSIDEIYESCQKGAEPPECNLSIPVDVITFKSKCLNADGSSFIVTAGLQHEVEHNTEHGKYLDCNRPPFTQCAWSSRFRSIPFPAINYGEDWEWVKQVLPLAKSEIHIPLVLHGYNFNPDVSEASTESNPHWTNPNHTDEQSNS